MQKARDLLLKSIRRSFLCLSNTAVQMDPSERYCYNPILRWNPQVEDYFLKAYGADHFSRISKALTYPSCYSSIRVNPLKTTSDAVMEKLKEFIKETRNGSLESKISIDSDDCSMVASGLADDVAKTFDEDLQFGPVSKCQIPGLDYVLFVKGSGPHTIDYGYAPDRPPKEVLVSRKCAEAVLRGAQVYVPGVIACSAHVEKGDRVAVSVAVEQPGVDGRWGVGITRGTVLQALESDPYHFERSGLYIGQGTTMLSRAGIFRVPGGIAVDMNNQVFKLPSFNDVLEGEIFLQNLPSIVAAQVLDPQKGERILDMCAAPGGKTTAIAILMKDEGEVVAVDRSHNKVLDIQKRASEMGLKSIMTYKLDATQAVCRIVQSSDMSVDQSSDTLRLPEENLSSTAGGFSADKIYQQTVSNEKANERAYISRAEIRKNMRRMRNGPGRNQCLGSRVESAKGFHPNSFDRVLLDAPCSALGLRPRLFVGEETVESLRSHAKYQRRMLDQAVQLVRPGGVIVYSTSVCRCTINPGENEGLVRYALDTYKFLSLAEQHPKVGGPGIVGRCELPDGYVEEWLRPGEEELVQRFDPSSPLDTIGFFIAKFFVGSKDA
ncbi:tRNA (cytosine(72)-C(5))-methyltransferase NSUN6 isoform X2 [Tripterygium wilfordii]|uniref:tRNA (cytosine(72)-C(5))-methyltransferase NSUN6 isoform X2 n=1 Tax=Tripterygium wilfordii TaxID=458696 RepID=UPI0018F8499A|nr:tRNA (cytosine(72)-C(5))-methyltransferase NSUN6 isoform X2 [Tripterygium wilfordii]